MNKIKVLVADGNFLAREGLKSLIRENRDFLLVSELENASELGRQIQKYKPEVLILDHASQGFSLDDLRSIKKTFPFLNILAITKVMSKEYINNSMSAGVTSYLLKDCDKAEINEAIYSTSRGEQFFCGKIVSDILHATTDQVVDVQSYSCDGIRISVREAEIISLVAEGLSNKAIAERLFLSVHTITTHRKNIMAKLGVNNTAGLVLFALKQQIISPNKYLFSSGN